MTVYKESMLNKIEDDLQGRNQNWGMLETHLADYMPHGIDNAGFHNSIFRGKNLGSTPDYANIANGTFKDMYIGDYFTVGGRVYDIAAFNYYINCGDTACTTNHVVLVPRTAMYTHGMNDTNTTDGGYLGTKMYASGLSNAKNTIKSDFSGHVLKHKKYFSNAMTGGEASAGEWVDSEVDLMTEQMVYGGIVNGHAVYGYYNTGVDKAQLPLFRLRHDLLGIRASWWLRDVASASDFARVSDAGLAHRSSASGDVGVRPAFSIS